MREIIKDPRNSPTANAYTTRQVLTWSAAAVAMVTACVCGGILFQRLFHREFLGEKTKLIHLCRNNPNFRPSECSALLAQRTGGTVPKRALTGNISNPTFRLSDDFD